MVGVEFSIPMRLSQQHRCCQAGTAALHAWLCLGTRAFLWVSIEDFQTGSAYACTPPADGWQWFVSWLGCAAPLLLQTWGLYMWYSWLGEFSQCCVDHSDSREFPVHPCPSPSGICLDIRKRVFTQRMVPRLPELKENLDNQHKVGLLSSAGLGVELDVLICPFHLRMFYNSMNRYQAQGGIGRVMLNGVPCQPSFWVLPGSVWVKIPNSQCFC